MENYKTDVVLSNGIRIPLIGLGTRDLKDKQHIINAISKAGFRFIDTVYYYQNEDIVGEAIYDVL